MPHVERNLRDNMCAKQVTAVVDMAIVEIRLCTVELVVIPFLGSALAQYRHHHRRKPLLKY